MTFTTSPIAAEEVEVATILDPVAAVEVKISVDPILCPIPDNSNREIVTIKVLAIHLDPAAVVEAEDRDLVITIGKETITNNSP